MRHYSTPVKLFMFFALAAVLVITFGSPTIGTSSVIGSVPAASASNGTDDYLILSEGQRCATEAPSKARLDEVERTIASYRELYDVDSCTDVVVPVCWHEIRNGANGNTTLAQIQDQIDILTAAFQNHTFILDTTPGCLTDSDNATWFTATNAVIESTIKPALVYSPQTHLNVYALEIGGGLLGYAQFPWDLAAAPATDGVVILWSSMDGVGGAAPYNEGDTLTHEVGHWLGLRHIWGDGGCTLDDYVADTALADSSNFGCPNVTSCGSTDDVDNFMDYTDDSCMNNFSAGQIDRACVLTSVYRPELMVQSAICGNGIVEAGEECDDTNANGGDGCSQHCQLEGASEICGNYPVINAGTISDTTPGQVCTYFEVDVTQLGPLGTITDINVNLEGNHTYLSDLQAFLTSPDGNGTSLAESECGATSSAFDVTFDDAAGGNACAWTSATDAPTGSLATFTGEDMTGTWTITVCDDFNLDGGTLTAGSLDICTYAEEIDPLAVELVQTPSSTGQSSQMLLLVVAIVLMTAVSAVTALRFKTETS